MGRRAFYGNGVGLGIGVGCGFGIGWGFGGGSLGFGGLGIGAGCGVGVGLGWGRGCAVGSQYINLSPEFIESKSHRPNLLQQVHYVVKRISTINRPLPPPTPA